MGGGGAIPPPPTIHFLSDSKSNKDNLFILSDFYQNKISNLLPKNQGHRPYLGLSLAFFITWPWNTKMKKCHFKGQKAILGQQITLPFLILIQKYTFNNFYASIFKNDFKIVKRIFYKITAKNASEVFLPP